MKPKVYTINRMYPPSRTRVRVAIGATFVVLLLSALIFRNVNDPSDMWWRYMLWAAVALVNLFGWLGALNRHARLVREHNLIYDEIPKVMDDGRP